MSLYEKKSPSGAGPKKGLLIALICGLSLVLVLGLFIGYLYLDTRVEHDLILDHVSVAGVDVGGMTKQEALAAVERATADTYTTVPMTITIDGTAHTIDPSVSCAKLDAEAAVEAAYNFGRQGFVFRRKSEQHQLTQGTVYMDLTQLLNLNTDAIRDQVDALTQTYNCTVVQSAYEVTATMPDEAQGIEGSGTLGVTLGTPGYAMDGETLYQQVLDAYSRNRLSITAQCDVTAPDALDLEAIFQAHCLPAVDATLDKTTFEITDHKLGFGFDMEQAREVLKSGEAGQYYGFQFQILEPTTTREDIEATLFADVLSEYTAKSGSSYNRDINLRLSCQAVNGTVLLPGDVFDYNATLGERTPQKGYQLGNTYSGMETIQTYGGGICQTSSTLYYCALMADLEIVTRTNHAFLNTYVPYGMDATVNWGTLDFKFKNNTSYPIKIEAYSKGGNVTVRLLGTDDKDYYVKMEYAVLGVSNWKTVEEEMPANNPKGYKDGQVITTPYTGYTVQTWRCKYDKDTDQLISREKETYSVYSKRDKVVCKIVEPAKPNPKPETPTPEPENPAPNPEAPTPNPEVPKPETPNPEVPEANPPAPGSETSESNA